MYLVLTITFDVPHTYNFIFYTYTHYIHLLHFPKCNYICVNSITLNYSRSTAWFIKPAMEKFHGTLKLIELGHLNRNQFLSSVHHPTKLQDTIWNLWLFRTVTLFSDMVHQTCQSFVEQAKISKAWPFYQLICFLLFCITPIIFTPMSEILKSLEWWL